MKKEKTQTVKVDGYYKKPINEIILHDLFTNRSRCGAYKIMFGDKYYIGQSIHVVKRAKRHQSEINKIFNSDVKSGKLSSIINHLSANKDITSIHVFMLEDCKESDLLKTEQKWLTLSNKDKNCLNSNFISHANPSISMAKNYNPVSINVSIVFDTQRELNLYNTFLSDLKAIKNNPRVNLKKWF